MIDIHHNEPKRLPPRRAGKGILGCNFKLARVFKKVRLKAEGKTVEEIAMIMGVCTKRVRNHLEWLSRFFDCYCTYRLIHILHSHGLIYTHPEEWQDYLDNHCHVKGLV